MITFIQFLGQLCWIRPGLIPEIAASALNFRHFIKVSDLMCRRPYTAAHLMLCTILFNAFIACRCPYFFLLHELGLDVAQGLKFSFKG